MFKFNFSNLNNRFKSVLPQKEKESEQKECSPCQTISPKPKPRYSAYRTVVMRHEELSSRLSRESGCEDQPCAEENNPCIG